MTATDTRIRLIASAALLAAATAHADDQSIQLLERKPQQRDMVISKLLDRVEALEQRLGIQHATRSSPEPAPTLATAPQDAGAARTAEPVPGAVVTNESEAERALERSLSRAGALLLRTGVVEIEPSLTFTRQEDRTPTLVSSGGSVSAGETKRNSNVLTADLALRLGLPWDAQLEMGIPYQWREVETSTSTGFSPIASTTVSGAGTGDVRVGLAKTLLRESLGRPDLVGRLTWITGSGRSRDGGVSLGGGYQSVTGSLSAIKRQDPLAFVGGLNYQYTLEKDRIQPGAAISANFGSYIALSPETALRLLFVAGYQDRTKVSGRAIPGSNRVPATLVLGGSTLVAPGTLLNLSVGVGLTDDADDLSVMLSVPMRFD